MNAIVPYKTKRQRENELYEKRCANLAKAREARGKLSTKLKQINRARTRLAKASWLIPLSRWKIGVFRIFPSFAVTGMKP